MTEQENLEAAILALEAQRATLGDAVVNAAQGSIREKLAHLLAKEQEAEAQLKYITVLFADVVGSTRMGSNLDPEDILSIMDGALQQFKRVIEMHGGKCLRFMGDGLMAAFGVPIAREDDARRAVQSGLDLLQAGRLYAGQVQAHWDVGNFQVRVGINTGQVIVGGGVEAENTVMGTAINIAARMESAALPDSVLISQDTYRHVRNLFVVHVQPPLLVKGKDEPMQTYLVQGAAQGGAQLTSRGVQGVTVPLVGRQAELARLQDVLQHVQELSEAQVVTVVGDPGIGKSRLLADFSRWVEAQPVEIIQFKGAASEQISQVPYSLLRSAFTTHLNIIEGDDIGQVCKQLEDGLCAHLGEEAQMKAHFIGALLGFELESAHLPVGKAGDPQQLRSRALFYLSKYFAALARQCPVILILDDIHWADAPSLEALARITNENPDSRLMVIYLTRLRLFQERPDWEAQAGERVHYSRMELPPLSNAACLQLVDAILSGADQVSAELRERVVASAEGNPFYLEEVLNMLIDDGVLLRDSETGAWRISPNKLQGLRVPSTLTAVLQARLESLALPERAALQQASVMGRSFWDSLLQALQQADRAPVQQLETLAQRAIIFSLENSQFLSSKEYCFKQGFFQSMVYETILKAKRQVYHARAAEWLIGITQDGGRVDEYAAQIARHFALAGEEHAAAGWYLRAGERAVAQAGYREALGFFDRALELLPRSAHEQQWSALLGRSEALGVLGEVEVRKSADAALVALAQEMGEDIRLAEAYYRQGYFIASLGEEHLALQHYNAAIAAAQRAGGIPDLEAVLRSLKVIGFTRQGSLDQAAEEVSAVLACLARVTGEDNLNLAKALNNISLYYNAVGDYSRVAELMNQAAVISRQYGDRVGEIVFQLNTGYDYLMVGMYEKGQRVLEQALQLSESIGFKANITYSLLNLGLARLRKGESRLALCALEDALSGMDAADRAAWAYGQSYLGLAAESSGDMEQACYHFSLASQTFFEMDYPGNIQDAQAGLARAHLQLGQIEEADRIAQSVWNYLLQQGAQGLEFPVLAFLTCAQVFQAAGDVRAATAAQHGHRYLIERADKLSDPEWRRSLQENVPEHRIVTQLWQAADKTSLIA